MEEYVVTASESMTISFMVPLPVFRFRYPDHVTCAPRVYPVPSVEPKLTHCLFDPEAHLTLAARCVPSGLVVSSAIAVMVPPTVGFQYPVPVVATSFGCSTNLVLQ